MYNCIGIEDAFIDVIPTRIVEDDRFVICSDGLSDMVDDEVIASHSDSAESLVSAALDAGGHDNVIVITLAFTA